MEVQPSSLPWKLQQASSLAPLKCPLSTFLFPKTFWGEGLLYQRYSACFNYCFWWEIFERCICLINVYWIFNGFNCSLPCIGCTSWKKEGHKSFKQNKVINKCNTLQPSATGTCTYGNPPPQILFQGSLSEFLPPLPVLHCWCCFRKGCAEIGRLSPGCGRQPENSLPASGSIRLGCHPRCLELKAGTVWSPEGWLWPSSTLCGLLV